MQNTERQDVYTRITGRIIESLEQGVRPWIKPWNAENAMGRIIRPLRHNGQAYSGINILMLWCSTVEQGFTCPMWMTFKQATELNAHVRKGEKGSLVVYANTLTKTEDDGAGNEVEREIPFLKGYNVFNVQQIEGLPEPFYTQPEPKRTGPARIDHAEAFFANTKADIRIRGARAYYAIEADFIAMPPIEGFRDAESYYATLTHECTHWTRHASRLDRDFRAQDLGRRRLCPRGTRGRTRLRFPLRRSGVDSRSPRRSRVLHRDVARSAQERQARHCPGSVLRTARRRFSPRASDAESRGRLRAASTPFIQNTPRF